MLNTPPTMASTMLLPPPTKPPSSKLITLLWCTISAASTYASLASLTTMHCFKCLTHPYTDPIITLVSVPIVILHLGLFFNLNRIPELNDHNLALADLVFSTLGYITRFVTILYPKEDSVEVVVFFVGLSVDVMAITKLVKPRLNKVVRHTSFAAVVRVSRMCFSEGGGSFWYLYVLIWCALVLSLLGYSSLEDQDGRNTTNVSLQILG